MIRSRTLAAAALCLGLSYPAFAHEGHMHTVKGTVTKVGAGQVEVKTPEGKVETVLTTEKTVVTRGTEAAKLADLAVGQRVVLDVGMGKAPLTAKGIKLGPLASPEAEDPHAAHKAAAEDPHKDHGGAAGGEKKEAGKPAEKGCCKK